MISTSAQKQTQRSTPVPLKQQAYGELKRLILSGELAGGTVQSVRQLAAGLSMSKTPVHAALERLEAEGLVTLAPQQGVFIRELSLEDIVHHYEIRQALEPFVMRRLAGRLTPEQTDLLRRNLAEHQQHAAAGRIQPLMQVDAQFHQHLCQFHGNQEIIRVMQQLSDKVQRVVHRVWQQFPDRTAESYHEHQAIFEALVTGDSEQAAQLAHEHLDKGLRRFWPNR